jgi:hypothetical protein
MTADRVRAEAYARDGFLIERGMFARAEVEALNGHFMAMHGRGGVPGRYEPQPGGFNDGFHYDFTQGDPLAAFPRVMWPHGFMPEIRPTVLDGRIFDVLEEILGEEALNSSSMFYFKPPRARGQALHQDNFYIRVKPGTCLAAWIACDRCDAENGALQVVPGSHRLPIYCPEAADPANYFAKELVKPPAGMEPVLCAMEPGDVLFFHGNLIHGSEPNRSAERFRRSLVLHYIPVSTVEVAKYDEPLLDRQGREFRRAEAADGGPCGTPYSVIH